MATQSNLSSTFPRNALELIKSRSPREQLMKRALTLQYTLIRKIGQPILKDLSVHPVYPFSKLFSWHDAFFMPKQLSQFYWYLASTYTIAIEVQTIALQTSICSYQEREDLRPAHQTQMEMMQWFRPLSWWNDTLELEWRKIKGVRSCNIAGPRSINSVNPLNCYTILFLNIKCHYDRGPEPEISYNSSAQVYASSEHPMLTINNPEYRELQKLLFIKNKIIPDEIWPSLGTEAPWEKYSPEYAKQLEDDYACYTLSTRTAPNLSSSSSSQNPQLNSLFQDSQDPDDFASLPLSREEEEIMVGRRGFVFFRFGISCNGGSQICEGCVGGVANPKASRAVGCFPKGWVTGGDEL